MKQRRQLSHMASLPMDDKDLDDAALWAVIDSAAAAAAAAALSTSPTTATATKFRKSPSSSSIAPKFKSPLKPPSPLSSLSKTPPNYAITNSDDFNRPHKISRSTSSPDSIIHSPQLEFNFSDHCLAAPFPTVSLFKDYQDAAMSILEKSDYTVISGNPFIKKSGWRKIAFYFNVSFEIRDKTIEFDENRNVQRAEFVARAYMQGGRFSDGWGSCERREKKFLKPNNDIPSTAETRAKNRACQDLLGIGQYRPSINHNHTPR